MAGCALLAVGVLTGCLTDAATRLAYDIESAASEVGRAEGSRYTLVHKAPSKRGECTGPYRVQFDRVGALVIWCFDPSGATTVSSHSTSYHRRFAVTPATLIVDKPAGEALAIDFDRRAGQVAIVAAR